MASGKKKCGEEIREICERRADGEKSRDGGADDEKRRDA